MPTFSSTAIRVTILHHYKTEPLYSREYNSAEAFQPLASPEDLDISRKQLMGCA